MRANRTIPRPSSERVAMQLIVDRQTPVKTLYLPLAVGNQLGWHSPCGVPDNWSARNTRMSLLTGFILLSLICFLFGVYSTVLCFHPPWKFHRDVGNSGVKNISLTDRKGKLSSLKYFFCEEFGVFNAVNQLIINMK